MMQARCWSLRTIQKCLVNDVDRQQLQDDLNYLSECSEKRQMLFNVGKYVSTQDMGMKAYNIQLVELY